MASSIGDDVTVLFVPGLREHVEDHWQTHAAKALSRSVTVEPITTNRLSRDARVAALDSALNAIDGDVVIAAHSAGCLMVARWAQNPTRPIRGALLATPADVENPLPAGTRKRLSFAMAGGCRYRASACRSRPSSSPATMTRSAVLTGLPNWRKAGAQGFMTVAASVTSTRQPGSGRGTLRCD